MEDHSHTEAELITVLPFWTVRWTGDREIRSAVRLYRSGENICPHRGGQDRCDPSGDFYGSEHDERGGVLRLCPRHWYAVHFDPHLVHHLLDMTDEEHEAELERLIRAKRDATSRTAEDLLLLGNTLNRLGFREEADKLYETAGWIRSAGR